MRPLSQLEQRAERCAATPDLNERDGRTWQRNGSDFEFQHLVTANSERALCGKMVYFPRRPDPFGANARPCPACRTANA